MLNTSRLLLFVATLSTLGLAQEKVKLPQEVILAPGQTASHFARMFRGAFCEVEKLVFTVTVTPENQKLIRVNFPKAEVGSEVAFVGNCRAEVWRYMPTGKYVVSDVNSGVAAMTPVPEPIGTKKPALQTRTATKKSSTVAKAAVPTPVKKSAPAPKAVVATAPKPLAPKAPAKVAVKATPKPAGVAKVPTAAKEKKQIATKVTPKVEQPVQKQAKPQVAKALPPPPAQTAVRRGPLPIPQSKMPCLQRPSGSNGSMSFDVMSAASADCEEAPAKDSNGLAKGEAKVVTKQPTNNLILVGSIVGGACFFLLVILGYCLRAYSKVNKRPRQARLPSRIDKVIPIEANSPNELVGKFREFLLSQGIDREPNIDRATGAAEVQIGAGKQGLEQAQDLRRSMESFGWRDLSIRYSSNPNGRVWLIAGTPPSKPAQQVIDAQAAQA